MVRAHGISFISLRRLQFLLTLSPPAHNVTDGLTSSLFRIKVCLFPFPPTPLPVLFCTFLGPAVDYGTCQIPDIRRLSRYITGDTLGYSGTLPSEHRAGAEQSRCSQFGQHYYTYTYIHLHFSSSIFLNVQLTDQHSIFLGP